LFGLDAGLHAGVAGAGGRYGARRSGRRGPPARRSHSRRGYPRAARGGNPVQHPSRSEAGVGRQPGGAARAGPAISRPPPRDPTPHSPEGRSRAAVTESISVKSTLKKVLHFPRETAVENAV